MFLETKINKKLLPLLTSVFILLMAATGFAQSMFTDTQGHWAKESIDKWTEYEVLQGYGGQFRPDDTVTRGEFATIISKIMGYSEKAENNYSDLTEGAWHNDPVLHLVHAGVMEDEGGMLRASEPLKRGEEFVMLSKAFGIQPVEGETTFVDDASMSNEVRGYAKALQSKGYLAGTPVDGGYAANPDKYITRAELLITLDKVAGTVIYQSGHYSTNITDNAVINKSGAVLEDMAISGDLYMTQGIGEGDVELRNVSVGGDIFVRGGGRNSIHLDGVRADTVYLEKNARVLVGLNSKIEAFSFVSNGELIGAIPNDEDKEGDYPTELPSINRIVVSASGATTIFGHFETLDVMADNATLTLGGSFETVILNNNATLNAYDSNGVKIGVLSQLENANHNIHDSITIDKTNTLEVVDNGNNENQSTNNNDNDNDNSQSSGNINSGSSGGGGSSGSDTSSKAKISTVKAENATTLNVTLSKSVSGLDEDSFKGKFGATASEATNDLNITGISGSGKSYKLTVDAIYSGSNPYFVTVSSNSSKFTGSASASYKEPTTEPSLTDITGPLAIAIVEPADNAAPDTTAPAGTGEVTYSSVTWSNLGDPDLFANGETVYAEVTINAETGYAFDTDVWSTSANPEGDGLITLDGYGNTANKTDVKITNATATSVTIQVTFEVTA